VVLFQGGNVRSLALIYVVMLLGYSWVNVLVSLALLRCMNVAN
jgi:hypothetical protein